MNPATNALLQQALALHEAGKFDEAKKAYDAVLATDPEEINTLTNLGLLHLQQGDAASCIPYIEKSIALYPKQPRALVDLGDALHKLNRLEEALARYDRAIALQPELFEAHSGRARTLLSLMRFTEATLSCGHMLALNPQSAYAYNILGFTLLSSGHYAEALISYDKVLELEPASPEILSDRGVTLLNLKRYPEALASYDEALAINPNVAAVHNNRGNVLKDLRRYDEALASYDRAIALKPDYADAHNNRALALNYLERFEEALVSVDHALQLQPDFPEAYSNRGIVLRGLGRHDEALACFDRSLTLRPGVGNVYWNKSMLLLLLGQQEEGWKLYEWRWKSDLMRDLYRPMDAPLWLGDEPLAGKTIFIHPEQGFGDFIQFCRYVPLLEARGARVILEAKPIMLPLMATLSPTVTLVRSGDPLPPFDLHCPIMSLPHAFRTRTDTVPADIPYLAVDPARRAQWAQHLGLKTRPRIGLAWSGSASHTNDHTRSMALAALTPLLQLPFEFHSLQKETRPSDEAVCATLPQLHAHAQQLNDFADTAALIEAMDLVITVDTSVAHLAGALGKPVWLLIATTPDYRWMFDREDTPWYPTARLFRQTRSFEWHDVIARLVEAATALFLPAAQGPSALVAEGDALCEAGQFEQALHCYDRAIAYDLHSPQAHKGRACALVELKRYTDAIASCGRLIALNPGDAYAYNILAFALMSLGYFAEAVANYDQVLALEPDSPDIWSDRAVALVQLQRFDDAQQSYDRALTLKPDSAGIYWNKSLLYLLRGDFAQGWALYEWRWKTAYFAPIVRTFAQPLWLGDAPLTGKTLLVHFEQGLGDFIQCVRYVPMLEEMGATVILEVPLALVPLVATVSPHCHVVAKDTPLPPFDLHCPIMSLPHALRTLPDTIPHHVPYLSVDEKKRTQWAQKLGPKKRPRIGLAWSGSPTHGNDQRRSMPLADLAPLLQLPFEFHVLQKEIRDPDRAILAVLPPVHLHDVALADFADTAALIEAMDLVITVDTSVAHLAGALGKPVWLLLPHIPDYRWLLDRADSPWYPTARLFRQPTHGDWTNVITQIIGALAQGDASFLTAADRAAIYKTHGLALSAARRFTEALPLYERAIALHPQDAEGHLHHGIALRELKRFAEALASYDRAIALAPTMAIAHERRAMALVKLERYEEAIAACEQALVLQPRSANVYNIMGRAQYYLGQHAQALASYDAVLSIEPNAADIYSDRAVVLIQLRRDEEALASLDRAHTLAPNDVATYNNRGNLRREMGLFDAAMEDYNRALALQPDLADAQWNKAMLLLLLGDFEQGNRLYEWRWKSAGLKKQNMRFPTEPLWLGETPIAGKTLLIHPEQGFGDFIQLCRYVPMLQAMGAHVVLETPPALMPVIATLGRDFTMVEKGGSLPPIDLHCPIMSLPLALNTRLDTIPNPGPYLFTDLAKTSLWKHRLGTKSRPRIGLVWSGSPTHGNDRNRSIALADLMPLLQLPFEFHSLQKEMRPADHAVLTRMPDVRSHADALQDFADTAALIDAMDVVITVDTSVAHLAGALGKPVWVLLPRIPDYRWLLDRADSPWYATARLFRQTRSGDWSNVIDNIIENLMNEDWAR